MLRPEVRQLDVSNGGIDAAQQLPVSVKGGRPDAGALLQIQNVSGVFRKGIRKLRVPKVAATLRPFYDFDFYCSTSLSAFRSSGLSVQERYLLKEEEQQQKAEARKQKREQRRREEKIRNDFALSMEQLMAEVNARVSAMTPEEKRALLEREKLGRQ